MAVTEGVVAVLYTRERLLQLTSLREFETKLGERMATVAPSFCAAPVGKTALCAALESTPEARTARFVLLGVPEDIGPRANHGQRGSAEAWHGALVSLLNCQSNRFFTGESLLVLGHVHVADLMDRAEAASADLVVLRGLVAELDERVLAVVDAVTRAGKVPIVIGGGHNNCFPIIRGISQSRGCAIDTINLDAHSDFRVAEGRHSGNGFRYAFDGGWLGRYAMLGLHESYNNEGVMQRLAAEAERGRVLWVTYDDIVVHKTVAFAEAVSRCVAFCSDTACGVEVDLDSVQDLPASAVTPCGFSTTKARRFIAMAVAMLAQPPCYLHITEGIPRTERPSVAPNVPKFTAYLITDFCKCFLARCK